MPNIKYLIILLFIIVNLNASMEKDIVYVENLDSDEISLKDEFFNNQTKLYTISVATLNINKYDPIEFFKTHKMTNALAYKFGENKEFARVISGIYKTGIEATADIKNLDLRLRNNKPYAAKLIRHQRLYKEDSGIKEKNSNNKSEQKKIKVNNNNNSIYNTKSDISKNLKQEFLNPKSKYYSLAIGSITLKNNSIENFFNTYDVGDKALAHVYGKNKDKARIIYGLYKTPEEAKRALENLDSSLKLNLPYALKMKNLQHFYKKYYPNSLNNMKNNVIIELKVNENKMKEKTSIPILSDNIKIIKKDNRDKIKEPIKKILPSKVKAPKVIIPKRKVIKTVEKKQIKKVSNKDLNKDRFIKHSKLEDVYYIESDGNFNILSEVFLNDKSSFYTVDFGELNLNKNSVEQFFIKNGMKNDALAYKYGKNNEYARIIYGAYENKNDAKNSIENIDFVDVKDLKVSNIKNHQKLYKEFHKINKKERVYIRNSNEVMFDDKIVLIEDENNYNVLKEEFFNRDSRFFTITLVTFLKKDMLPETFFSMYNLGNNVLAYPIGTVNNYYRVLYGLYNSSEEAKEAIRELPYLLRKNLPYISRIKTNQKKFESYNNRNLESETNRIEKIQFR